MWDDSNRWVLKLVCLALAVTITGCTTPVILHQRVVEVEKIVLKDTAGNVRFEVSVKEDGSLVQTLRDKKGNERIALMVDAEGVARQRFFDENGKIRLGSYVYPADHPKYAEFVGTDIMNKDGHAALKSYIDAERVTRHVLIDENGKSRVTSYVFPAGHPRLPEMVGTDIMNKDGGVALESYIDTQRVTRHVLHDENGVARMGSYAYPADHPKMAGAAATEWVNNGDSGAWIRIRTAKDGGAYHEFMDKDNKERISLNVYTSGMANQLFSDTAGTPRSIIFANQEGYAGLELSDSRKNTRFQAMTLPDGKVAQSFMDRERNVKSSTTVTNDGQVTHYVEKGALEKIWDNRGWIMLGIEALRNYNSK